MKNKTIKIFAFLTIMLFILSSFPLTQATFSYNVVTTNKTLGQPYIDTNGNILFRTSNSKLWAIFTNSTISWEYIYAKNSSDNGLTWGNNITIAIRSGTGSSWAFRGTNCVLMSNDTIIIATYGAGATYQFFVMFFDTKDNGVRIDLLYSSAAITHNEGFGLCVDSSNNIYVTYSKDGSSIGFQKYDVVTLTWGLYTSKALPYAISVQCSDCVYLNNKLYIFVSSTSTGRKWLYEYYLSTWIMRKNLTTSSGGFQGDIAVYNNNVYIVYNSSAYNISLYSTLTNNSFNIYEGGIYKNNYGISISININGLLNIIWSGLTVESPVYYQFLYITYDITTSSLSSKYILSSGSYLHVYPHLLYQWNNMNCMLTTGFIFLFTYSISNDLLITDSGNVLYYTGAGGGVEGKYIKFKFYDGQTGDEISMYNYANGFYKPPDSLNINSGMCSMGSSLFPGYYFDNGDNNKKLDIIQIDFIEGRYYPINITSAIYYDRDFFYNNGDVTLLQNSNNYFKLYNNMTYSIILYPIGYTGYYNEYKEVHDGLIWGLRTDKKLYVYPEQIRLQYLFPTASSMIRAGKPLDNNWKIYLSDVANWNRDSAEYKSIGGYIYDAQWHDLSPFTPPDTVDGIDKYLGLMFRDSWLPGFFDDYVDTLRFTVLQATNFIPSGNITSILPYPINIGEEMTVTFNANNNGRIDVKHVPTDEIVYSKEFDKPVTSAIAKMNFARVGLFEVNLYVSYATNMSLEDTETFYINVTGDDYEEWGYNVPYLMVEGDKIITEFDTLIVYYKSLVNNTEIRITSPRGSRAPFSTMVSNSTGGILKIPFKSWMTIGKWNISMNISTYPYMLNDYFNVIANENNYIDFPKNEYVINESISFYIRHNVRCKIVFLYGDIPKGYDIFFENGTLPEGDFNIVDTSFFDYGTWTIQMWQTNNRIPIRLLAEDIIIIKEYKSKTSGIGGIGGVSFSISPPFSYFAGMFLIIVFTVSPIFLYLGITKGTGRDLDISSIPSFLYFIMAGIGFILSVMFGWFPLYSIFVLLIMGVLIVVIIWLRNKDTSSNA